MSKYLEAITESLIDVLNGAARSTDHRIMGYAANVDFWTAEIVHCVAAIDGFPKRQEVFTNAVKLAVDAIREAEIEKAQRLEFSASPSELLYGESFTSAQGDNYLDKTAGLRARLIEAAKKFLGRLRNEQLISLDKWRTLEASVFGTPPNEI